MSEWAGNLRGVAPRATLVDVRVLDCDGLGTVSDVIAGLEYVAREHPRQKMAGVVTLSLGLSAGASSLALEQVRVARDRRGDDSSTPHPLPRRRGVTEQPTNG